MRNQVRFASGRALDVICLGRFAVDLDPSTDGMKARPASAAERDDALAEKHRGRQIFQQIFESGKHALRNLPGRSACVYYTEAPGVFGR